MTELRFLFLSESQTLLFYFLELPICQVIGCDGAQVKAESLFYWVSPSSFLRNFRLFFSFIKSLLFLQIDLHINLGAVCVSPARHWTNSDTGSVWIMADTDHTPSKQKQSLSFQLWDGTISCVLARPWRKTTSLPSSVWLCSSRPCYTKCFGIKCLLAVYYE